MMQEWEGQLSGLRILVVEDQLLIAMSHEDMLRRLGCAVVGPVSTVDRALAAIRAQPLDGALLDVNLNGKNILLAAEALARRNVPFILVTGYDTSELDPPVLADAPRLTKPFGFEDLAEIMARIFADRTVPSGKRRRSRVSS